MDKSKELNDAANKIKEIDAVVKSIKRRIKKHPEEKELQKAKGHYYEKQFFYLKAQTRLLNEFINHQTQEEDYGNE